MTEDKSENLMPLNLEQLKTKTEAQLITRCDELIKDIEKFKNENKLLSQIWISVYILFGLMAVVSSSVSAILTFSDFTGKTTLFIITFLSTASAYILTFLNPSGREEKRRQSVKRSRALLEKVKNTRRFIGLKQESDTLAEISNLSDQ